MCIRIIVNIVILFILGALGIGYMKIYSNVANDVLTIIALGLSIVSDDISDSLAECCIAIVKKSIYKIGNGISNYVKNKG